MSEEEEKKRKTSVDEKKKSLSLSPLSLSLSLSHAHLHPPLDRDLLHVPGPVRLAAERRVPHLDPRPRAPPEEREVGDLERDRAVEEVGEVKVGGVVADDDVRVGLDDEVPAFCFFNGGGEEGRECEWKRKKKKREKERQGTSFFFLRRKRREKIKLLKTVSPPPPQQARLVLERHHFRAGDRSARVEREDVFDRRGGLALDL